MLFCKHKNYEKYPSIINHQIHKLVAQTCTSKNMHSFRHQKILHPTQTTTSFKSVDFRLASCFNATLIPTLVWCFSLITFEKNEINFSTIGGFTIVLKSEGIVKKHQADVLGVYRWSSSTCRNFMSQR